MKRLVYVVLGSNNSGDGLILYSETGKNKEEIKNKLLNYEGEHLEEELDLALNNDKFQKTLSNDFTFIGSYYGDDMVSTDREIFFDIINWERKDEAPTYGIIKDVKIKYYLYSAVDFITGHLEKKDYTKENIENINKVVEFLYDNIDYITTGQIEDNYEMIIENILDKELKIFEICEKIAEDIDY